MPFSSYSLNEELSDYAQSLTDVRVTFETSRRTTQRF